MSNAKKTNGAKPVEGEVVEEPTWKTGTTTSTEPAPVANKPKRWNVGGIFWGLLFVLVGTLLLLDNLNVIQVNLSNLWQLWPVLIIGAGISMLSLRGWVAAVVASVLGVGLLVLVTVTVVENPYFMLTPQPTTQQVLTIPEEQDSTVKNLDVSVATGAAEILLSSSDQDEAVVAKLDSSHMTLASDSEVRDATRYVTFTTESTRQLWLGSIKNKLELDVTRDLPLSLRLNIGASSLGGDMAKAKLSILDIKAGATTIDLKLGTVMARQEVTLEAGASTVTLDVPKTAGVRVYTDGGLNTTDFEDIDKTSEGVYQTKDFDTASSQITIRAKLGASTFTIDRY